ncbi:Uncharacterised protein [Pseudomonas aeruginosa]|nr:Uncharacterised protein [Pseudomonas aeruginosa]
MPWVSRIGRLAGTESRQERKADEVAVALPAAGGVGRLAEPVGLVQPYGGQLPGIARAGGHPRGAGSRGGVAGGVPRRRARRTGRPAGRAGSLRPRAYRQLPGASGRPALRCRGRGRRLASGVPRGAAGQPGDPPGAGAPAASRAGPAAAPAPQATGGAGVPEPLAVDRLAFHPPGARRASRAPGSAGHRRRRTGLRLRHQPVQRQPRRSRPALRLRHPAIRRPALRVQLPGAVPHGLLSRGGGDLQRRAVPRPGLAGMACLPVLRPVPLRLRQRSSLLGLPVPWLGHALHPGHHPALPLHAAARCQPGGDATDGGQGIARLPGGKAGGHRACREPPYRGGEIPVRLAAPTAPRRPPAADARRLRRHPPRRCLSSLFADLLARRGGRRVERPRRGLRRRHRRMAGRPPGLRRAGLQREQPATPRGPRQCGAERATDRADRAFRRA